MENSSLLLSKLLTVALGHPSSYTSIAPAHPCVHTAHDCIWLWHVAHCPFPTWPLIPPNLSSWGSCLGSLFALLKYVLNKKHLFMFFHVISGLGRRHQHSMRDARDGQRRTSSTWKGSSLLSALFPTMSGVSPATAAWQLCRVAKANCCFPPFALHQP